MMEQSPSQIKDAYRERFKYFKSLEVLSSTLNLNGDGNDNGKGNIFEVNQPGCQLKEVDAEKVQNCRCHESWGLRHPSTWTVTELKFPKGLIVIKNPFTMAGQRYWIVRSLMDFPHHRDYVTNFDNLNRLEKVKKGEVVKQVGDFKLDTCCPDFYKKLRWVTFGYHHDWDTKVYSENMRSSFPDDLADMTKYIGQILGFPDFEAEAAIANYYHMDSTLSGHVDQSEVNIGAPLFSLSFGQSAIFLIGGRTKQEVPSAVVLESGDIAIMSGESRLSYHGVPKVFPAWNEPWNKELLDERNTTTTMDHPHPQNKRQKLDSEKLASTEENRFKCDCEHDCVTFSSNLKDPHVLSKLKDIPWTKFTNDYVVKSRINLNIRQVLLKGQSSLP